MNRGVAIPVVLFTLALASALAIGGAYVTRQLAASTRAAQRGAESEPMSERALVETLTYWDSAARAHQPIGTVVELPASRANNVSTNAWITRISASAYWLVAESTADLRPVLRRRIGLLIRVWEGVPAPVPERAWSELP
ncbi:MAG TPA: hypothetical protein VIF32_03875 [Gemmatimonadaceae bacterium]|jgi:hypothetical protein